MARIFITGSSDGIGQAAAKLLSERGNQVFLHARNQERASSARAHVPKAAGVLLGDLTSIADTKRLAASADSLGPWDAVIHNAGVGPSAPDTKTGDGIAMTFQVNTLAPYILTCSMRKPRRLLYLSSSLHSRGDASLHDVTWTERRFSSSQAYSDSKLQDTMLAAAIARRWPDVQACSLDPGWIRTKMGGSGAPGQTSTPAVAIADFAAGASAIVGSQTGVYFNPSGLRQPHAGTTAQAKQDELLAICAKLSGVGLSEESA